jgi:hypothetical protein
MANVFGTPLGLNAVYTIASAFINAALPVMAYPSITLVSGQPTAVGTSIYLKPNTEPVGDFWVTFISGLAIILVHTQGIKNGMVM